LFAIVSADRAKTSSRQAAASNLATSIKRRARRKASETLCGCDRWGTRALSTAPHSQCDRWGTAALFPLPQRSQRLTIYPARLRHVAHHDERCDQAEAAVDPEWKPVSPRRVERVIPEQ